MAVWMQEGCAAREFCCSCSSRVSRGISSGDRNRSQGGGLGSARTVLRSLHDILTSAASSRLEGT